MRTMELHTALQPISSRTLVARLRDMEKDDFLTRTDFGGNPPHIEYQSTERGTLLLPLADAFRQFGESLACGECEERKLRMGNFCGVCPRNFVQPLQEEVSESPSYSRRRHDDSIVLL